MRLSCVYGVYYFSGFLVFLMLLGLYGICDLYHNDCSIQRTTTATTRTGTRSSSSSSRNPADTCAMCCVCCDCGMEIAETIVSLLSACCDDPCGSCFLLGVLIAVGLLIMTSGVFVLLGLSVIIGQRTIRRHLFQLQKKRLTNEYRVLDLSDTPTHNEEPDKTTASQLEVVRETNIQSLDTLEVMAPPTIQPQPLPPEDTDLLKHLGLWED